MPDPRGADRDHCRPARETLGMTTHPGGPTETLVKTLHHTECPAHPNMLAMGCMEKSAQAEPAGWLMGRGEAQGQGWEDGDGRMEMRERGWEGRDRTETGGQRRKGSTDRGRSTGPVWGAGLA